MSKLPQHKGGCLAGTASADGITARAVTYDRPWCDRIPMTWVTSL